MVILGGWVFLMSEVPFTLHPHSQWIHVQGFLANKDTHRHGVLQQGDAYGHRTTLGAACVLIRDYRGTSFIRK